LQAIPQIHLVGDRDKNMPVEIAESFKTHFPPTHQQIIQNADHACCWAEKWPILFSSFFTF
jgi:hypothetical protein